MASSLDKIVARLKETRELPITYHHNRRQAWRKRGNDILPPGAVDISFEVHKRIKTPEAWAAWWEKIDNRS
jgi:hypothetical protein